MKFLLVTILWIYSLCLHAQTCDQMLQQAQAAERRGDYFDAYKKYDAALSRCGEARREEIERKKQNAVAALERQNREYKAQRGTITQQESELRQYATTVERQRDSLQKANMVSIQKQWETQALLLNSQQLTWKLEQEQKRAAAALDKIYFYQDKFGLAYDKSKNKYGFINREDKTMIDFEYDEAQSFDAQGLARVGKDFYSKNTEGKNLVRYLIDTTGHKYKLALRVSQIDEETKAVDLSFQMPLFYPSK